MHGGTPLIGWIHTVDYQLYELFYAFICETASQSGINDGSDVVGLLIILGLQKSSQEKVVRKRHLKSAHTVILHQPIWK